MCKCNPSIRTPFCGKMDCQWPDQEPSKRKPLKLSGGEVLPEWLQDELYQLSPEPGDIEMLQLLIKDYIKRNAPCDHNFEQARAFWDPSKGEAIQTNEEYCRKCGVKR